MTVCTCFFGFTVYVCLNLVSSLCFRFFFFSPQVLTPQLLCEDDLDSCVFVLVCVCVWGGGGVFPIQRQGTMNAEINVPAENAAP